MSNIRVTYSGLIALAVSILSVITGTVFVILVTRTLNPDEFGLWTLIGSLVSYVLIIDPIISYWTTRQIARGEEIGRTSILGGTMFSVTGMVVYFIASFYLSFTLDVDFNILLLAAFLIPLAFFTSNLNSICMGFRPQAVSYGLVTFETVKIPLGFFFVIFLEMGLYGVLLATILSSLTKVLLLYFMAKPQIIGSIKKSIIKFWLKMSWLTMSMSIGGFIYKLDVLIFSLITNSLIGLAFWGVSQTSSSLVTYSTNLSQALYPRLLAEGKKQLAEQNMQRTMYFAIPLLCLAIVFAKPSLHVLNPIYVTGVPIVILVSLRSFVDVLITIHWNILSAYEKVDLDKNASLALYLKSKLFKLPMLTSILSGIYVAGLTVFLIFFQSTNMDIVNTVTVWASIPLIVSLPFAAYGFLKTKKELDISMPLKPVLKYLGVAVFTSIILYYMSDVLLTYPDGLFEFLPQVIPLVLFGAGLYFGITFLIDSDAKILFKSFFSELRKKLN